MALRTRLFLLFGGLIAGFALAQGWLARTLAHDVEHAVDDVAFQVGTSVVSLFVPAPESGVARWEQPATAVAVEGLVTPGNWLTAQPGRLLELTKKEEAQACVVGSVEAPHEATTAAGGALRIVLAEHDPEAVDSRVVQRRRFHFDHVTAAPGEPTLVVAGRPDQSYSYSVDVELASVSDQAPAPPHGAGPAADIRLNGSEPALPLAEVEAPDSLFIPIPRVRMLDTLERFQSRLQLGSLALLGVAVLVAGWMAHRVSVPLRALASAARELGGGALGRQLQVEADPEVATVVRAFNEMSLELARLDAEARSLREREHLGEIGELARGLAHSLRNPLHGLGLALEELAGRTSHPGALALAQGARAQIRTIDRSLRTFLALSTSGKGGEEPTDLAEIARDVALEAAQDGRARVEIADSAETPRVRAVPAELRAVVQALVVNAAEASPPGSAVRLGIAPGAAGGARLVVEDEGPGLPAAVRERLFQPHVTTKEHGSGLGLYLSQRIASHGYGGSLVLEDRAPHGTRAVLEVRDRRRLEHGS